MYEQVFEPTAYTPHFKDMLVDLVVDIVRIWMKQRYMSGMSVLLHKI